MINIKVIRPARERAGYTRKEFAELVGLSYEGVAAIENGASNPSAIVLLRVAKELDLTVDDLLDEDKAA